MEELKQKIKIILKNKLSDYSDSELDEMIADYGEIAIMETLDKSLKLLDSDVSRQTFGDLISDGKTNEAFEFAQEQNVDISKIFEEIANAIAADILN